MKVIVTRKEIKKQTALLADIEAWEKMLHITEQYSGGVVAFCLDGNNGQTTIRQPVAHHGRVEIDPLEERIRCIIGRHAIDAIKEVIVELNEALPIPME